MKRAFFLLLSAVMYCFCANAQQGTTIDLRGEKPPDEAKKTLRSEKTGYDDMGRMQKFLQNTYVHYNYLFNANQIYNGIMADAVASHTDDYSRLLSFYPYDEKTLAANHLFDSVIKHATEGLLLHDLRNDYVDELYFVTGKSYFFLNKLDTAQQTFQYITYAFAPKDDGYFVPVGSNLSNRNDKDFSISSKEAGGLKKNNLKNINRRNDAMLWLARAFAAENNYTQADILLNNIGRDVDFPERLKPLYYETKAYSFYRRQMYDSAAFYLSQSASAGDTRRLRARRAYLTAQLFRLSGNDSDAVRYYAVCDKYSDDPVQEIYAEENMLRLGNRPAGAASVENGLKAMLRKNKYYRYKDLIYYGMAQNAHDNKEDDKAVGFLQQSIRANRNIVPRNMEQRSKSFLLMGDIQYDRYRFDSASRAYDSVSGNYISDSMALSRLKMRQPPLSRIAANIDSIHLQDSLLALANMPEKQRMDILRQKAKAIRRAIDRREESDNSNVPVNNFVTQNQNTQASDLFAQNNSSGDWYFNSPTLKSAGYRLFKQKWGNRPNVDNWQRQSALTSNFSPNNNSSDSDLLEQLTGSGKRKIDSADITPEDLLASLPMTAQQKAAAVNTITGDMLNNGEILMNGAENFSGAIVLLDSLLADYPHAPEVPKALYDQFVCYTLLGDTLNANLVRSKLFAAYPGDKYALQLQKGNRPHTEISPTSLADTATKAYADIYDLFLAGKFDEAVQRKADADKKYGNFYWTPQLLYIEAVYHVSKQEDSVAIDKLNYLIRAFRTSPIVPQAKTLTDVLKHRKEIEAYLASLHVSPIDYSDANALAELESAAQRLNRSNEEKRILFNKDSLAKINVPKAKNAQPGVNGKPASELDLMQNNADTAQAVAANNNPAQNAENNNEANQNNPPAAQPQHQGNVTDTSANVAARNLPPTQGDTTNAPANLPANNKQVAKPASDNTAVNAASKGVRTIDGFTFDDNAPVYVTVVLDNVAAVFASEAPNAFNRYNLLTFPNNQYNVSLQNIGEENLVLIGPFRNLADAKSYQAKIQPQAGNEIIPWLTPDKYSFLKISPQNLGRLHSKADVAKYRAAAEQAGSE